MLCKKCYKQMIHVMSFEKGKSTEFERCPKCFYETKHKNIKFDSFKTKTDKLKPCKYSSSMKGRNNNVKGK